MRSSCIHAVLPIFFAAMLSACGGGSGGVESFPTPTPTPTPTPPPPSLDILDTGGISQQFASKGVTYPGNDRADPLLDDSNQLLLRYDAASKTYEIQLPSANSWVAILPIVDSSGGVSWATADNSVSLGSTGDGSAAIVHWSGNNFFGVTAVVIPAPASSIPTTGSGTFAGTLVGYSSELVPYGDTHIPGRIIGTIDMLFNFGSGTLSGSIAPRLTGRGAPVFTLPTLAFKDTVYSDGSTTFSGRFDTNVSGLNSFSGLFAGSTAKDIAGNFAFPYLSPQGGSPQQASGAFTGTKTGP